MSKVLEIKASNFDQETSSGITLVDFWAPWCAPCHMQEPVIEKIDSKFAGKAMIGKCNIDEERTLAIKLGVKSIPTLIIFQNGRVIE